MFLCPYAIGYVALWPLRQQNSPPEESWDPFLTPLAKGRVLVEDLVPTQPQGQPREGTELDPLLHLLEKFGSIPLQGGRGGPPG